MKIMTTTLVLAVSLVLSVGTGVVVHAAVQAEAASEGMDIWTVLQKGGAPMALGLFLLLAEVTRRHDKKDKIIEAKDLTIKALSERQITAIEAMNEITGTQVATAQGTEALLRQLVTLLRGKLDIS